MIPGSVFSERMEIANFPVLSMQELVKLSWLMLMAMDAGSDVICMALLAIQPVGPVSYTHLDVYKRQGIGPL